MNEVVLLPVEVQELAVKVSETKQAEVNTVLNQIFAGTSDWKKQAESIEVKGVSDTMSIQLAEVGRKNVKAARLSAEKIFDAKREEVQQIKSEYDLEDKLWLKAKQTAVILFKDIESTFEWKANFVKRYETEQKELQTQLRVEKVSKFAEINRFEFENMSNEMFDLFLSGLEKNHNDRIKAEQEAEAEMLRLIEVEKENARLKAIEDEKIRKENARLKADAEAKEKELAAERAKVEAERKAEAEKQAAILANERKESELKLKAQQENARKEAEKQAAERAKVEAELQSKKDAELKAQREKEQAEKARLESEKKAAKAPRKEKLTRWVNSFELPKFENDLLAMEIEQKFNAFKYWAKNQINTL